jgi:hypothetical protein
LSPQYHGKARVKLGDKYASKLRNCKLNKNLKMVSSPLGNNFKNAKKAENIVKLSIAQQQL